VKRGETIASLGSSGRSTGPHLHYEVLAHRRHVDPVKYIIEEYRAF
jgi:murein DD-endopeptidase MepM/ murein hydrolase activator NlpD